LIEQKIKKMGVFWRNWVSGGLGTKWEIWGFGWPAVNGYGGEWPEMVSRWWGKWWVAVEKAYFGFREERAGGAVSGVLYGRRKNEGEGGKM
jgi:hypothetical protein